MKNKIALFALFLFLSGQMAFAQKTLPQGVQPYAENWTYTLVNAMHRAGFDMPTMKATPQPANIIQQRNALQLDSTKTFNAYNSPTGDSTPVFKTRYLYPSADSKMEISYQYDNGVWKPINRALYVNDDQQRIVEVLGESYNEESQSFFFDSRLDVFPHGNSDILVDSFFTYAYDTVSQNWLLLLANRNTFDAQDKQQENLTTLFYLGEPIVFKEKFFYDAHGDNHLIEETGSFGGEEVSTGKTEMTYVDHQLIEAVVYASDGFSFFPQERSNYAYNLNGSMRKEMSFEWNAANNNFQLVQTIDFFYDNQNRLAGKETVKIQPNAWDEKERVSYAYVEGTDLYLEYVHNWNDDLFDWILDSKKYFYYDGSTAVDPTPATVKALSISPNPGTGVFRLNLASEAVVHVFDATGKMMQSTVLQPGQDLNITALMPGMYTLMARQGTAVFNGKIVKL